MKRANACEIGAVFFGGGPCRIFGLGAHPPERGCPFLLQRSKDYVPVRKAFACSLNQFIHGRAIPASLGQAQQN